MVKGNVDGAIDVPVRLHSECLTGDLFGSLRCDCGDQLERALRLIGESECGVLLYLRQEGRGIGLMKKLQAYNLQDQGLDTVEANLRLGHREDERDYLIASAILQDLKVNSIRLITNNPKKISELRIHGIEVTDRISIEVPCNPQNEGYLRTKANKMQHLLGLKVRQAGNQEFVFLDPLLGKLSSHQNSKSEGVFTTVSYVQSLDGYVLQNEILPGRMESSALSYVLDLNRYLRGFHDAWVVDLAQLRSIKNEGFSAHVKQLLIWDELLVGAECATNKPHNPDIILCSSAAVSHSGSFYNDSGIEIIPVDKDSNGYWRLDAVYERLCCLGIKSLLVEGSGLFQQSMRWSGEANYCVVAIMPGVFARDDLSNKPNHPHGQNIKGIRHCHYHAFDQGILLHGPAD